jgi:hypothetical protein
VSAKHRKPRRRRQRKRFGLIRAIGARLTESVGSVRHAIAEPRSVPLQIRDTYLRMWHSRGGGFYGLGYVIAFIVLEIRATVSSWENASDDIAGLVVQEVLQFVFRFAAQSFLNGFLALGWPLFVVEKLGGAGLALLAVVWWLFDRYARPWIAARLPEPPPKSQRRRGKRSRSRASDSASESLGDSQVEDHPPESVGQPIPASDPPAAMSDAVPNHPATPNDATAGAGFPPDPRR